MSLRGEKHESESSSSVNNNSSVTIANIQW